MAEARSTIAAVIGGGPAGLMAADVLSAAGCAVHLYEAKPSFGRKLLMAGKSGLNITKSEYNDIFLNHYTNIEGVFEKAIAAFLPRDVLDWCHALGIETFTGSSGRAFPRAMKASPLLRAWLARLSAQGVRFFPRHRWTGIDAGRLIFNTPDGDLVVAADACVFALGGKSWARLGSDGAWCDAFSGMGVRLAPFQPSNCGFDCGWDAHFAEKFAGEPVKGATVRFGDHSARGDFVVTRTGVEGGVIYPLAAAVRDALSSAGSASIILDLKPDISLSKLEKSLSRPRRGASLSNHLRKTARLAGVKAGLLRFCGGDLDGNDPAALAIRIKHLPLAVVAPRPIDEAISTAGGVMADNLNNGLMLKEHPGLFVAGEMLDWDAPTGGYLLTACLATGKVAGEAARDYLAPKR